MSTKDETDDFENACEIISKYGLKRYSTNQEFKRLVGKFVKNPEDLRDVSVRKALSWELAKKLAEDPTSAAAYTIATNKYSHDTGKAYNQSAAKLAQLLAYCIERRSLSSS